MFIYYYRQEFCLIKGAVAICSVMTFNQGLKKIDFFHNRIEFFLTNIFWTKKKSYLKTSELKKAKKKFFSLSNFVFD